MSTGGVFKIIANDGKPDRLLVATAYLNQRLSDVMCARQRKGMDPTPTLMDIEATHILHVNAHFKPFAAIGFEYNKVRAQSGQADLSSSGTITFSIPQFGDFFHDMVARQVLGAAWSNLQTAPNRGLGGAARQTATSYGNMTSVFPADGENWGVNAAANATYSLVDAFGQPVAEGTPYRNMVRWCEFPGERLYHKVDMAVNGNPLDEYWTDTVNMLRKFTIGADKLHGYKQLVGQETELVGYGGPRACPLVDANVSPTLPLNSGPHGPAGPVLGSKENVGQTPAEFMSSHLGGNFASNQWTNNETNTGAQRTPGAIGIGPNVASPYAHVNRLKFTAVDGPQTPKYWQPPMEIWNRLWFWFNRDVRLSVPSVSIPYGQRFVNCKLDVQTNLLFEYPGIFVRQDLINDHVVPAPPAVVGENDTRTVTYRPYFQPGNLNAVTISPPELYVNNIFVNPEVHDIYIRRIGFSLIRVYRRHIQNKTQGGTDQELLSGLKWPIEYMFVGFRPQWNQSPNNPNQPRDWHRFGATFNSVCELFQQSSHHNTSSEAAVRASVAALVAAGAAAPDNEAIGTALTAQGIDEARQHDSFIGQIIPDEFIVERPVVENMSLTAHGINIHDAFPQQFFSSYNPMHFGNSNIVVPDDPGVMMINFSVLPGCYQPGGYLNVSRARELYLGWNTLYSGPNTTTVSVVIAVAINFLLISDGSAVLRYST